MSREEVAHAINWPRIIWLFGIVNVTAMLPQLFTLIRTHETAGLNIGMFAIYLATQIAFSLHGFFNRDKMLMWCLGISAVVTIINISLILYYR